MHIPENNKAITKNGLEIEFEIIPHNGEVLNKNNKWVYHSINAYTTIDNKRTEVGYLNIAYVDEEKKKEYVDNILMFAKSIAGDGIKYKTEANNIKDITIEELNSIFPSDETPEEKRKKLKVVLEHNHKKRYKSFMEYHYMKPEPDFINVNDEFKRQGIGTLLYAKAVEFLGINGLKLYQSTTQTHEAQSIWEKLKTNMTNVDFDTHKYISQNKVHFKNRYFIDHSHLKIDLKNDKKISNKKRITNSI